MIVFELQKIPVVQKSSFSNLGKCFHKTKNFDWIDFLVCGRVLELFGYILTANHPGSIFSTIFMRGKKELILLLSVMVTLGEILPKCVLMN